MDNETSFIVYDDVEVPGPVLKAEYDNRYGSVPGLDDSELADVDELERQVIFEELGPVLQLPVKSRSGWIKAVVDEAGGVDFGAFGTVDFERTVPEFDRVRYKADKLREQLKDLAIRMAIVRRRLPRKAVYLTVKYLKMGLLELDDIVNHDMWCLARLYLRACSLRAEISMLEHVSEARRQRKLEKFLEV